MNLPEHSLHTVLAGARSIIAMCCTERPTKILAAENPQES
jgi:hypothetical protein